MRAPEYMYVNEPLTLVAGGESAGVTISARICESPDGYTPAAIGSLSATSTTVVNGDYVLSFAATLLRSQLADYAMRRVFVHVTSSTNEWYEVFPVTVAIADPDTLPRLLV